MMKKQSRKFESRAHVSFVDKIWTWAMNNTTVSASVGTLVLGLFVGGVCVALDKLLV